MKYLDLLKQKGSPAEQEQQLQDQAAEAKLSLESDILATSKALRSADAALREAKSAVPFSASTVVEKADALEALKKGLKALEELKAELFS